MAPITHPIATLIAIFCIIRIFQLIALYSVWNIIEPEAEEEATTEEAEKEVA